MTFEEENRQILYRRWRERIESSDTNIRLPWR